ncbi:hypothetical protein [Zunongwangia atlantica]|uniref:Uncharacterized protein n=1 Tax=Zunongwangia atlantica 22II14-10F7 TaxID=1185767 RepID=A0A1Y1T7F9_9FLAO|nr:hypothetical protein [Zunongwangia atlantica]ORL46989.1 hypothetical protein IIF7_03186 [Zunongwangia atlantica 22II14-10F7]
MDIQATKLHLLKVILENDNKAFIQKIAEFVKNEQPDFWNNLSKPQQEEIDLGIKQLEEGKRIPYDSVLNKIME